MRCSHSRGTQEPPEAGRGKGNPPQTRDGKHHLASTVTLGFWLLELLEHKFCTVVTTQLVMTCYGSPGKLLFILYVPIGIYIYIYILYVPRQWMLETHVLV